MPTPNTRLMSTACTAIWTVSVSALTTCGSWKSVEEGAEPVGERLLDDRADRPGDQEEHVGDRPAMRSSHLTGVGDANHDATPASGGCRARTITNSATASIRLATAAADAVLPFSMNDSTRTETTSVENGLLPLSSTSEPYSAIARANDSAAPAAIAGTRLGRMIRRKIVSRVRAQGGGCLLDVVLELLEHRLHRADDERQRHERQRQEHRLLGVGPVQAQRAARCRRGRAGPGRRRSSAARTGCR